MLCGTCCWQLKIKYCEPGPHIYHAAPSTGEVFPKKQHEEEEEEEWSEGINLPGMALSLKRA